MFDLDIFRTAPGIDVNAIKYVRIVDIIGNGTNFDNWPPQFGGPHPIYDPYPTTGSAGFDLDAVGVRYLQADPPIPPAKPTQIPMPAAFSLLLAGALVVLGTRRPKRGVFVSVHGLSPI